MGLLLTEDFSGSLSSSLTVTDTGAVIASPSNGKRRIAGGLGSPVWGNPGFRYGPTARSGLGPVTALVRLTNFPGDGPALVIQDTTTLDVTNGIRVVAQDYEVLAGVDVPGGKRRRSITYMLVAVPRPGGGSFLLLSGGAYGTWPVATLVEVTRAPAGTNSYIYLAGHSATWFADWLHVHDTADTPITMTTRFGLARAADDFTGTNGTNINGRTALGTSGVAWNVAAGTATIQSNALSMNTSAVALLNVGAGTRSVEAMLTRSDSGSRPMLLFRAAATLAGSWRVKAEFDRVTLQDSTGSTVQQTGAITFTEDVAYHVKVVDTGSFIEVFVNGTSYLTHSSTAQNTNTRVGVACENGNGIADDFAAWPETVTLPSALGPMPTPPSGQGAAVVNETFPGADGSALPGAWTAVIGTWRQQSGKAEVNADSVQGLATISAGTAGVNHEIEADITLPATTPTYPVDWYPGVKARVTDQNNLIDARMLRQYLGSGSPSNEVEVWEYVAGTGNLIGYINLGDLYVPGNVYNLRLAVSGVDVAAYLDDELVVEAETVITSGSLVAIGTKDSNPSGRPKFDNVQVRSTGGTTQGPVISSVQVVWRRSTTALITWTTDVPARGRVDHGPTSAWGLSTALSGLTTSHSHTITGITPGATWHFSVYSEVD